MEKKSNEEKWPCDTCKQSFTKKQMVWMEDRKKNVTKRWCCPCWFKPNK